MLIAGALSLVGITVFFLLHPIITGKEAPLWSAGEEPSEAQFRKRISLLQLRDAEYEYAMGKLGEEDYQALRSEISAEALSAIQEEEAEHSPASGGFEGPSDAELEEEIATVRSRLSGGFFCSECGHPNPEGSRFCGDCGTPISAPNPVPSS
ncbi:MAG: zinc-ribbon domain-containing protein [Gemmatimonadetes bacterium]|nr:zinc-ribbon domain-containing protein [Gemmatimonadota bacterium]